MRLQIPNSVGPACSYSRRKAARSPLATDLSTCPKSSSGICRILSGIGRIHNQGWRFNGPGFQTRPVRRGLKNHRRCRTAETFCAGTPYWRDTAPPTLDVRGRPGPMNNRAGETMVNATPQATTEQQHGRTVLLQLLAEVARGNKSAFARLYGL